MTQYTTPERDYLTLPDIVKQYPIYVGWNKEERRTASGIKITKVPYNVATGGHASSTDSLTWAPFDQALAAYLDGKYDGIGPVISTGDPFTFIDCDDAIDSDERERLLKDGSTDSFAGMKPWARFVRSIAPRAYVGLSQSGRGLHIIMRGKLPGPGGKRPVAWDGIEVGKIEMYDRERFIALTGVTL